jgi:CSLREA domain-containing protein
MLVLMAAAALVAVLAGYGSASAQVNADATITVNTLEDQTDLSANDGQCSLRGAIFNADNGR